MIVEIRSLHEKPSGFAAILAGFDLLELKSLANAFARWSYELKWDEVPDLSSEHESVVILILDAGCLSYSIKFGDNEYRKLSEDELKQASEKEKTEEKGEEDEPADDL